MSMETLLTAMVTIISIIAILLMMILTVKIYRNDARPEDKEPSKKKS